MKKSVDREVKQIKYKSYDYKTKFTIEFIERGRFTKWLITAQFSLRQKVVQKTNEQKQEQVQN